ncbi:agmatinase [Archaeoglobus veneficus]|uniref:Agmatinase n=1 Tax=Archaeoglobus veneficus (strain DSM 11195 / SNP6) TaxID=693661 RepID=F2KMM4_ARCVS|nr:agmatinase [Archaeoglobus veneficus]AEA47221.1 agmatinase [Archaeoglobus veneficus SNP6]
MHIDSFFACSNSNIDEAEFVVFGIPYDATQSFKPGSRFAPNAIREASWNLEDFSLFSRFSLYRAKICDAGNINVDGDFEAVASRVEEFMSGLSGIPIALGGEHTVSYACAKNFEEVCFVVFDAHFDLRDKFDGNPFNHACTSRRVYELGHKLILIGVRSCTEEELQFAEEGGIKFYTSFDVIKKGMAAILKEIEGEISDRVYLSVDVDAFDPAYAPGVSTPEPFGITPFDYLAFLEKFADRIVGMDVVEVVPDSEKVTQILAAKLVVEFIARKHTSSFFR